MLSQNTIFFAKIVDDLQLTLVHPAGDGDQHEPKRIQDLSASGSSLSRPSGLGADGQRIAFSARTPGKQWEIYAISAQGGSPEQVIASETEELDPSWSADGNSLVFGYLQSFRQVESKDRCCSSESP